MPKFQKKPVVIEAVQYDGTDECARRIGLEITVTETGIQTLEGFMRASPGDWIITGVKGERYPCKPDVFEATYAPVSDAPPPADAKETPAAGPGLVFGPRYVSCGEPRRDGVAVDGCAYWIMETGPDDEDGPWFWGNVDGEAESCATESEAIAAANAHNAARLKGGE